MGREQLAISPHSSHAHAHTLHTGTVTRSAREAAALRYASKKHFKQKYLEFQHFHSNCLLKLSTVFIIYLIQAPKLLLYNSY